MAATTEHYCFEQPKSTSVKIWRYMDFYKLMYILSYKKLFLTRSDIFKDPWEGVYSQATFKQEHNNNILDFALNDEEFVKSKIDTKFLKNWTYINCWHMNEFESAAMWDLYSSSKESIAIQTTYKNLVEILPENSFMGCVNYIDYTVTPFTIHNQFAPFMFKRKSFIHEKEVRIIIQDERQLVKSGDNKLLIKEDDIENDKKGIDIDIDDIDIEKLINKIYISPTASKSFFELVKKIVNEDYELKDIEIIQSDLYTSPIY